MTKHVWLPRFFGRHIEGSKAVRERMSRLEEQINDVERTVALLRGAAEKRGLFTLGLQSFAKEKECPEVSGP